MRYRKPFDQVSGASCICYVLSAILFVGTCVCAHCDRKAESWKPGIRNDVKPEQAP